MLVAKHEKITKKYKKFSLVESQKLLLTERGLKEACDVNDIPITYASILVAKKKH